MVCGIVATFPAAQVFTHTLGSYFPTFRVEPKTVYLDLAAGVCGGRVRGHYPAIRAIQIRIADGLQEDRLMAIPISYNLRNLWTRRLTTSLTVSGMALVVFVFAAILMLANGLQKTLVETGSYDNVVVLRKGASTEVVSGVGQTTGVDCGDTAGDRHRAAGPKAPIEGACGVDRISTKKGSETPSNVTIRGIDAQSLAFEAAGQTGGGTSSAMGIV